MRPFIVHQKTSRKKPLKMPFLLQMASEDPLKIVSPPERNSVFYVKFPDLS
jgi:hypothetical protein